MLHARCNVSFLQFMFGVLKKREWGVGSGAGGGEVIGCYHCSAFYLSVSWFFFFLEQHSAPCTLSPISGPGF